MLDEDDGDALFVQAGEQRQNLLDFRMREPRHHLVGNEELRFRRHGTGEFQLAHLDLGEVARQVLRFRFKTDFVQ